MDAEQDTGVKDEKEQLELSSDGTVRPVGADRMVGGFLFQSSEDAEKARVDLQKIDFLHGRFAQAKLRDRQAIYEKAIENHIFRTVIGWDYLSSLRRQLIEGGIADEELSPIPVDVIFVRTTSAENYVPRQRIRPTEVKPKRDIHYMTILSVAINVLLAVMVVVMFLIAYYSDTDNILNYKENVTDRYATWQQELTERERAVRERERALNMERIEEPETEAVPDVEQE